MKKRIIAVIMTLLLLSTLIACSKQPITSSEKRVSESVADDSVNTTSDESKVSDEEKTVSSDNSEINSTAEVIQPEEESTAEKNEKSPVKTESENSATENSSAPLQSKKDNAEETKKPVLSTEDKPILTEPTKDSDDTKMSESETEPPKPKEPEHDDENQETTVTKEPEPTFDINYAGQDTERVDQSFNDGNAICNDIIRGSIVGKKLDEDGNVICGAIFGLFKETETEFTADKAILTAESDDNGIFTFKNVPFGRWIVREIKSAPAFVLNEDSFAVTVNENEQVVEIEIENEFIVGSVQTIKVDKDYPENTLAGAVFEIYLDVDNNKEYTEGVDTFVGEMTEGENGVYFMENLRYNGYLLHEKEAPEGFLKDDGYYYFEIRIDGETVTVENEAGVGFINQPITGKLELTKTDIADGKPLAGVGFRIKNENGNTVIEGYTGEDGIIKFTLRYGKYTYSEFDPLEGYVADTKEYPFEIKKDGQIIKASISNEKIPVPDIPQTGDNSNIGFWIGLGAVALGGLIAVAIIGVKRKKDDED